MKATIMLLFKKIKVCNNLLVFTKDSSKLPPLAWLNHQYHHDYSHSYV